MTGVRMGWGALGFLLREGPLGDGLARPPPRQLQERWVQYQKARTCPRLSREPLRLGPRYPARQACNAELEGIGSAPAAEAAACFAGAVERRNMNRLVYGDGWVEPGVTGTGGAGARDAGGDHQCGLGRECTVLARCGVCWNGPWALVAAIAARAGRWQSHNGYGSGRFGCGPWVRSDRKLARARRSTPGEGQMGSRAFCIRGLRWVETPGRRNDRRLAKCAGSGLTPRGAWGGGSRSAGSGAGTTCSAQNTPSNATVDPVRLLGRGAFQSVRRGATR